MQSDDAIATGGVFAKRRDRAGHRDGTGTDGDRMLLDCGRFQLTDRAIRFRMIGPDGEVATRDLPWSNVHWVAAGIGREWGQIALSALASFAVISGLFWFVILDAAERSALLTSLAAPDFWQQFDRRHAMLAFYAALATLIPGGIVVRELVRTGAREGWMEIKTRGDVLLEGLLFGVPESKVFRKMKGEPVRFRIDVRPVGALVAFLAERRRARLPLPGERMIWRIVGQIGRPYRLD